MTAIALKLGLSRWKTEKITDEMIPDVAKQPEAMDGAAEAGRLLGQRLKDGHDRMQVTQKMQEKMMAMFEGAV